MGGQNSALLAESYSDWWPLAGVDALVGEEPAGWLVVPHANEAEAATPKRAAEHQTEPFPLPPELPRHAAQKAPRTTGPDDSPRAREDLDTSTTTVSYVTTRSH